MNPNINHGIQLIYQHSFVNFNKCTIPVQDVHRENCRAWGGGIYGSLYILLNFSMSISCSKNKVSRNKNKGISKRKQAETVLKDSTNHKRGGEVREWGKEKEMNSI